MCVLLFVRLKHSTAAAVERCLCTAIVSDCFFIADGDALLKSNTPLLQFSWLHVQLFLHCHFFSQHELGRRLPLQCLDV
jgi:hypothetical protein